MNSVKCRDRDRRFLPTLFSQSFLYSLQHTALPEGPR